MIKRVLFPLKKLPPILLISVSSQGIFAQTTETFYMNFDRYSSLTGLFNQSNASVFTQTWSPWGQRVDADGTSTVSRHSQGLPMRWGFYGQWQLLDSDVTLIRNRAYYAKLGRYLNPSDGSRANRFSFAFDNPL